VALLTSTTEGLPGALIEAAMCGLPLVGTDVGFVRDVVVDGVTGRLVPVGSAEVTAAALAQCFDRRAGWGPAARRLAVDQFDNERVADRWLALLRSITG
jgi:glycosyltransferase involved in cell wall biosynthesis